MARTEKQSTAQPWRGVTSAQLREAERGLRLILAATFSPVWIAQNVREVLAEANADYVVFVGEHGPARNPIGWLIERGRLRALNLVARQNRRSGPPLDSVIGLIEDPEPTPEETALEQDRIRRIEDALAEIPEKDRKLIALVYYEGRSIRAAGRLLGWGKSNADYHHKEAMKKLAALVGPRDLLSPALVGLVAQAAAVHDRGRLVGGIVNRIFAAVEDFADLVARTFGSASRNAGEAARRAVPFADTGTAAVSGGGAGRLIAQCGALATAAICSAIIVSSPPVEQVLTHRHSGSPEGEPGRSGDQSSGPESSPVIPAPTAAPPAEEASRSSATARFEEARRIERRRRERRRRHRARRRRRRRRRAKIANGRRVRKEKAEAKASRAKRNERIEAEAPEEVAPEVTEPAPEVVAPEVEPAPPPPATGGQTREEFGL